MNESMQASVVECARSLAIAGRSDEALALLASPNLDPQQAGLLRGKVLAQQGRFAEAITAWQEVLEQDPQNAEASAGLARVRRIESGGSLFCYSMGYLLLASFCVVALASALVWGGLAIAQSDGGQTATPGLPLRAATDGAWQVRVELLEQKLQSLEATAVRAPSEGIAELNGLRSDLSKLEARNADQLQQASGRIADLEAKVLSHETSLAEARKLAGEQKESSEEKDFAGIVTRLETVDGQIVGLEQQIREYYGDALQWRAYDLTLQGTLDARRLAIVEEIAAQLQQPGQDGKKQEYGRRLTDWVETQRRRN